MTARRKPVRERDIVSFGRRTPRFNLVSLKEEALETTRLAKVITPNVFRSACNSKLLALSAISNENDGPLTLQ